MNSYEIALKCDKWTGERIRLYLKVDDTPAEVIGAKKVTVAPRVIELTSHGTLGPDLEPVVHFLPGGDYSRCMVGDDNYGYWISAVEKVEWVRTAKPDEMGAMIRLPLRESPCN